MSKGNDTVEACEALWLLTTKNNTSVFSCDADRSTGGTYPTGYRNDIHTFRLPKGDFEVRAQLINWRNFNPSRDAEGTRRVVEVLRSGVIIFRALQEGRINIQKFDARERSAGTEVQDPKPWAIDSGSIPPELKRELQIA